MDKSRRDILKYLAAAAVLDAGYFRGAPQAIAAPYLWHEGRSLPSPTQEIYPTVFNGEIYVGGGFVPEGEPVFFGLAPSTAIAIYNPVANLWRAARPLPDARHHLGMASSQHFLYGIGGFSGVKGNAWQARNEVFRLSSAEHEWQVGPSLPVPLAESVYASHSGDIHVIGGKTLGSNSTSNTDTYSHYVLVDDKHWESAAPSSVSRNSAASAVLNNNIYVVGGRQSGKAAKNLSFCEFYSIDEDKWVSFCPLPVALAGLAAVALNGRIFVSGGEAFGAKGDWRTGKAFRHVWSYDANKDSWAQELDMPEPRHGHGAVAIENSMFIMGGAAKVGPQETLSSMRVLKST